jgi:signal transduction histidine kinase/DNA-binding response OmpR family regulator
VTTPTRILHLGDDDDLRKALQAAGGELVSSVALEPDVVVLELAPRDQRRSFARVSEVRSRHPETPLLIVARSGRPEEVAEAVRAGADEWIVRPVDAQELRSTVERAQLRGRFRRDRRRVMEFLERQSQSVEDDRQLLRERLAEMSLELERAHRGLAEAHEQLQSRVGQLVMLYRIGRDLSRQRNWDQALASLLDRLCAFLEAGGASLLLASDEGRRLNPRSSHGVKAEDVGRWCETLLRLPSEKLDRAELVALEDIEIGRSTAARGRELPWRITVMPLWRRGRLLGHLLLDKGYRSGQDLEEDYHFLITIQTVLTEEVASAQAFDQLYRLQRFQERTLDHLGNGVVTVDGEGRLLYSNARAREMIGDPGAGSLLREHLRLASGQPRLDEWLSALDSAPGVSDGWIEGETRTEPTPVSVTAVALAGELPGERHYVCVLEDQGIRRELEAQRRRAARQSELLIMAAEWAHDVRTPLTGILHNAELLAEALPPASPKRRHFRTVEDEVKRINVLVSHFLDYARPAHLKRGAVDPGDVLHHVGELMRHRADESGISIHVEALAAPRRTIPADRDQLQQVLLNLVTNAIEAGPPGSRVLLRHQEQPHHVELFDGRGAAAAILEIEDEGPGVPPEHLDRLFVPFFTTKVQGTGLGLAISEKIVRAHDGQLRYERRGRTTVMKIVLPMEGEASQPAPATGQSDGAESSRLEARG